MGGSQGYPNPKPAPAGAFPTIIMIVPPPPGWIVAGAPTPAGQGS